MSTQLYQQLLTKYNISFSQLLFGLYFSYQGHDLIVVDSDSDKSYLRFILLNVYSIESDADKMQTLEILNELHKETMCVNGIIVNDSVWLQIEMFIDRTQYFDNFFFTVIDILTGTEMQFNSLKFSQMQKIE